MLQIEWDMGDSECKNDLKQFEGEGFDILEIFALGHEFDIRNIGTVANQVYMYNLEINLDHISEMRVLSINECKCIGNFQNVSINEMLLFDTVFSAQQLENIRINELLIHLTNTQLSSYYPVIQSSKCNQLKFLRFKDTTVDLSTLQGNWLEVQFIDCVCVNKMNNFKSTKVTFNKCCQFKMSQLTGHCEELVIQLSSKEPNQLLELFSEPFNDFGTTQNLKLIEFEVDLNQIRGKWNEMKFNYCTLTNSTPNDLTIKKLVMCNTYPFIYDEQFAQAQIKSLSMENINAINKPFENLFKMSSDYKTTKLEQLKLTNTFIDLNYLKGKWGKVDMSNCKMQGENNNKFYTDKLHLVSSNSTSEINAKHIEAVSSTVLVNSSLQSLNVNNCTITFKQQEQNEIIKVNAVDSKIIGLNTCKCHKLAQFSMNNNKQSNEIQKQLKRKEELTGRMKKLQKSLDIQQQLRTKKIAKVQQLREKESKYKQTLLQPDKE
ncbi:Hypothetical_protein [Hexamita inflata]|uniref:Hypothetical_protein n=1 Tax=Hexamita inflata TaxID=28002 RepID=A0ABP1IZF0_9EUKA